jgi:CHASE3 domain sensor protein
MNLDLSIGQRLAIGSALMIAVLAGVLMRVSISHEASTRVQSMFARQIVPLTERADTLERGVYRVAVGLRDYVITPDERNYAEFRVLAGRARTALRAVEDAPKNEIQQALFQDLTTLVNWYLLEADAAIEQRRNQRFGDRSERALAHARERAVNAIRDFAEYQAQSTRAALAELTAAREALSNDLRVGSILAFLCFAGVGFGTARGVRRSTRELLTVAKGFETGLWKPALAWTTAGETPHAQRQPRDEMARLRRALGAAAAAVEQRESRLHADAQVASAASASLEASDIAEGVLVAITEHLRAEAGAVYAVDTSGEHLRPIATYALEGDLLQVRMGEGLPGEAARSGRPIVLDKLPDDTPFQVKIGFEQLKPKTVAAVPIMVRQEAIGAVIVASLRRFDDHDLVFLRNAAVQLGVGLSNAMAHELAQKLLRTLENQNRELAEQNATLQTQNERIQTQNEEIQAQNEEIQAQSEELQAQAQEIASQNEELRRYVGAAPRTARS